MGEEERLVVGVRVRVTPGRSRIRDGTVVYIGPGATIPVRKAFCMVWLDRYPGSEKRKRMDVGVFSDQLEIIYG